MAEKEGRRRSKVCLSLKMCCLLCRTVYAPKGQITKQVLTLKYLKVSLPNVLSKCEKMVDCGVRKT